MQITSKNSLLAAGLIALVLCGCSSEGGKPRPKVAKVKGTVTYNGKPVGGATITFTQEKAPRAAGGTTDDAGRFQLTTYDTNDGAVLGTHVVTIAKIDSSLAKMTIPELAKGTPPPPKGGLIPSIYSDPAKTPLRNTVENRENNFNIELSD